MLQNDLDLEIIDPDGNRHLPWVLDGTPGNEANPAERRKRHRFLYISQKYRDHRNTIEQVVVDVPDSMIGANWKIRVRGHEMRRGPQSYTLVSKVFEQMLGTDCGDFANGDTTKIAHPYELPDTWLAWAIFWLAVILLLWLVYEMILWLYDTIANPLVALVLSVLAIILLFLVFRLIHLEAWLWLACLVLLVLAYVWWRLVYSSIANPLLAFLLTVVALLLLVAVLLLIYFGAWLWLAFLVFLVLAYVWWRLVF